MTDLIWQFYCDTDRGYDGSRSRDMADASRTLAEKYCARHGLAYHMEDESKFYASGVHGGPAMDRFQLFEERYDEYDHVLYLDTDVLISPRAPDIFHVMRDVDVAGHNHLHGRDAVLLQDGWLKGAVDPVRYKKNYMLGFLMIFSRRFRQWFRAHCDPMLIEEDKGKSFQADGIACRWPVYDQSLMSYWLCNSPFSLTPLDKSFGFGPYFVHYGGEKTEANIARYFRRFEALDRGWSTASQQATSGPMHQVGVALLRRRLFPRMLFLWASRLGV